MQGRPDLSALDHLPEHQALVARMLATVRYCAPLAVEPSPCCLSTGTASVADHCVCSCCVHQVPEERPRMIAVRRHLLWWRAVEQLNFLCNLSQFLKGKRHLAERLNAQAVDVLRGEGSSFSGCLGPRSFDVWIVLALAHHHKNRGR